MLLTYLLSNPCKLKVPLIDYDRSGLVKNADGKILAFTFKTATGGEIMIRFDDSLEFRSFLLNGKRYVEHSRILELKRNRRQC